LPPQEFARVAEAYGDGTARLTPEENILFVNIPNDKLPAMLADPLFTKFKVNPGRPLCLHQQCCSDLG
jgi:ferredoxin-nitrite reductase